MLEPARVSSSYQSPSEGTRRDLTMHLAAVPAARCNQTNLVNPTHHVVLYTETDNQHHRPVEHEWNNHSKHLIKQPIDPISTSQSYRFSADGATTPSSSY